MSGTNGNNGEQPRFAPPTAPTETTESFFPERDKLLPRKSIVDAIKIPENSDDCPHVIVFLAPARSGTTAMIGLMSNCESVEQTFFQPYKALMRHGEPNIDLSVYVPEQTNGNGSSKKEKTIFMKDTYGPSYPEENFDLVGTLIDAGVPANKISAIYCLRDPQGSYPSWLKFTDRTSPEVYAASQAHAIEQYEYYKGKLRNTVPLSYEMFIGQEREVLQAILDMLGINEVANLEFNEPLIAQKLIEGEAANPDYQDSVLKPTWARGRFECKPHTQSNLPSQDNEVLEMLCRESYSAFSSYARREFWELNKKTATQKV